MSSSTTEATSTTPQTTERGVWSEHEHAKFLEGLRVYPEGPWKNIAILVGTRSARQVQTHAQKYYEKVARHVRGLRKDRKKVVRSEHRMDESTLGLFKSKVSGDTQMGQLQRGLQAVELGASEDLDDTDWVTRLRADEHLGWIDTLLQDEDNATSAVNGGDAFVDIDDSYLSYLAQILDAEDDQPMSL